MVKIQVKTIRSSGSTTVSSNQDVKVRGEAIHSLHNGDHDYASDMGKFTLAAQEYMIP